MKSELTELMNNTGLTIEQLIDEHLVFITSKGEPQPDKDTVIDIELVKALAGDFRFGDTGRRMCYYDKESNSLKNGINFRRRAK